ncbi:biotin/lipoyl-binding protein, partial [Methylobrevis pamukkalensis]|uniref:HlyD family efflux transporter periplasmic adaptor subunit n=1 Tax=Methylobrevis pamukkalensis TaxID=1439726 RepID=UPI001FD90403
EPVRRGAIEVTVSAAGTLQAIRDVEVGAQVSGQLEKLHVDIGDAVASGDLLAEIDPASIATQVEIAEAELANLKAQHAGKTAEVAFRTVQAERQRRLTSVNGASQAEREEADFNLATAQAAVAALEAQIRKQEAQLAGDRVDLATRGSTRRWPAPWSTGRPTRARPSTPSRPPRPCSPSPICR